MIIRGTDMKKKTLVLTLAGLILLGLLAVQLGAYNFAATDHHWRVTQALIDWARDRSVDVRSEDIQAPNLNDDDLIARGAGEYEEMCTGCHLKPGMEPTELARGLYPHAPVFYKFRGTVDEDEYPEFFWVIKNGLKMTGMPAWGLTHDDQRIWSMAAFVSQLPGMTPAQYEQWVERGEAGEHEHEHGEHEHGESDHEHEHGEGDHEPEHGEGDHEHEHGASEHSEHDADQNPASEPADGTAEADGPVAALTAFHAALAAGNTAVAAGLLSPDLWVVEGGRIQHSRDEYASEHLLADAAFMKNMQSEALERHVQRMGDLAWVVTRARTYGTYKNKTMDSTGVETAMLRRTESDWKIAHLHWSR